MTSDILLQLDGEGLPAGPGESPDRYAARLEAKRAAVRELDEELARNGTATVFDSVRVEEGARVPAEIIREAGEITRELYDFEVHDFPGFFLSRDVGLLWGGCLIADTELPLALFLLRGNFRNRRRFLIYDRRELLAHELCHAVRQELHDVALEEFFAYQTSPSRLRRYLGNCFIRERDALAFVIPALLLLAAELVRQFWLPGFWVWPFWIAALGAPAWLLARNAWSRREYFRAEAKLRRFGASNPRAVLFRATAAERKAIAAMGGAAEFKEFFDRLRAADLRWQVIGARYFQGGIAVCS